MSSSNCACLDALMRLQELPDKKGLFRFIDGGQIMDMRTGDARVKPVLRALKEGKDGRLSVTSQWMPVYYCPNCGTPVKSWAQPEPTEEAQHGS